MPPFVREPLSPSCTDVTPPNTQSTSPRPLATALGASALLHAMLLVSLSGLFGAAPDAGFAAPSLHARLTALPANVPEARPVPDPVVSKSEVPRAAAARPAVRLPAGPRRNADPPKEIVFGRVSVNVDADGPVEAALQALIDQEPSAQRVALEFADPPIVDFPAEVLRDVSQRRIRTLVRVRDDGAVEFVRTDEYDDTLVLAIREALDGTRAKPAGEATTIAPGWAIVVFWFELSSPPSTR